MSKKQNTFTDEEKRNIALEAASGGEDAVRKLSEKHGVSEEDIRNWIRAADVTEKSTVNDEDVSLDATSNFIDSVNFGANFDRLNYRRLIFWSVFGTVIFIIIVQSLIFIHDYTKSSAVQLKSEQSQFYDADRMKLNDQDKLNSFRVIDPEAGIYSIPIDSAITLIANE